MRIIIALWIAAALLVACNGGGGSDDTNDNNGGSDGPDTTNVDITDPNLSRVSFNFAQSTLLLGRIAADAFLASEQNGFATLSRNCATGGNRSVRYTDSNSNGAVSPGDRLRLSFTNCGSPAFDGTVNGDIELTMQQVINPPGPVTRRITATETFNNIRVSEVSTDGRVTGDFELTLGQIGRTADIVTIRTTAGHNFRLDAGDGRVSTRPGGLFVKRADYSNDAYQFGFDATLDASASGQGFTVQLQTIKDRNTADDDRFHGQFSQNPTRGVARTTVPGAGAQCALAVDSDDRGVATANAAALRYVSDGATNCLADASTQRRIIWPRLVVGQQATPDTDVALFKDNDIFNVRRGGLNPPQGTPQ